jgi:tetratricopeptide (TPR) repeat protein
MTTDPSRAAQQGVVSASLTADGSGTPQDARRDWFLALALVLATVLAYLPVWRAGFIWDDNFYVTDNPLLNASDGLRRIWFSLDSPSQYFPLTYTTFYLEHALWGLNPAGYHVVNLLLHAANALLAWRLLARLRVPGAWLAAALFALHPVQVESVAWITERKNVLMGFFFLLSLLAWTRFIDETNKRPRLFYGLALALYALALFAKTTACTLPAALLLVLWLKKMPIGWRRLAQVAPFLAMGIGMGLLTVWWERYHQGTQGALFGLGPVERVLIASRALWFYAGKLLWPAHLTFSYPRWTISASDPLAYGWLLAAAALGWVIWRARRRAGRGLEVAAVFFAATLSPVLGFIMLYTFVYSFVADHYQYLACLGPLALLAAGLERVLGWVAGRTALLKPLFCAVKPLFCAGLPLLLGALTFHQCGMYADAETLWRVTLARNPASLMARNNLGNVLFKKGHNEEAIAQFRRILEINPDYAEAHDNLGTVFLTQGDWEEAVAQFRKAVEIKPDYAEAWLNLGTAFFTKGYLEEAIAQYRKALEAAPYYAEARNNLGKALFKAGEPQEAIAQFRKAVKIEPGNSDARYNLGSALFATGDREEAIAQYREAVKIKPDFAEARNNLGIALFAKGEMEEAIAQFRKAVEIKPDYTQARNNLAKALAQAGVLEH